jgi:hypothetical protein
LFFAIITEAYMHPLLANTFGGLTRQYYFRNFIFALVFSAMSITGLVQQGNTPAIVIAVINALLYPYSRFVYESIIGFIMGENIFILPLFIMLPMKLFTMLMCWGLAILISPIGLIYLYFHHRGN